MKFSVTKALRRSSKDVDEPAVDQEGLANLDLGSQASNKTKTKSKRRTSLSNVAREEQEQERLAEEARQEVRRRRNSLQNGDDMTMLDLNDTVSNSNRSRNMERPRRRATSSPIATSRSPSPARSSWGLGLANRRRSTSDDEIGMLDGAQPKGRQRRVSLTGALGKATRRTSIGNVEKEEQEQERLAEEAREEVRRRRTNSIGDSNQPPGGPSNHLVHRHPYHQAPPQHPGQQTFTLDLGDTSHNKQIRVTVQQPRRRRTESPIRMSQSPVRSALKDNSEAGQARRAARRQRRSSISFCEQLEIKDIVPAKELVSDSQQLWWQNSEYAKIVELSEAIVSLSKRDPKMETRGLEDLMEKDHEATFRTRFDVLRAQEIMKERQFRDDEALGGLYHAKTAKFIREAARRASKDEEEVQQYLADTRQMLYQPNRVRQAVSVGRSSRRASMF